MSLPVHQVRKGQPRPAELFIHPDTEIMQGNLCRQTGAKPAQLMRPLSVQAKGLTQLIVDRFDDLTHPRHPATQRLRPWHLAIALGRTDALGSVGLPPRGMVRLSLKALLDNLRPQSRNAHTPQSWMRPAAQGTEGVGPRLGFGARC